MKQKAINALLSMGMPASIKGFGYIVDTMVLFESNKEYYHGKTMNVYEKIAKQNNSTASRVERAIRHAFSIILTKGNSQEVSKYFTDSNTTNSNLLHVLYLRLTQNE